jgi:magnesium chelatase subunit I
MLYTGETQTTARIADFWGVIPAITGKVEMVYEGEQEGPHAVALAILGAALKKVFLQYFPHPGKLKKGQERDPYGVVKAWFAAGNNVDIMLNATDAEFTEALEHVAGLRKLTAASIVPENEIRTFMELALHGLSEFEVLNKNLLVSGMQFSDFLTGNITDQDEDDDNDMRDLFN